jgi:hypothetical protein
MKNQQEDLRPYVADMSAVVKHIEEAVARQKDDDDFKKIPQALDLVSRLDLVLLSQGKALENHLDKFPGGGVAGAVKSTVTSALGLFAGLYDKVRSETASRGLRDDYTALSLAAVSYTMLYTSALALNESSTADLALRGLKELTPFIMQINEVIPQAVVSELKADGKTFDASVLQRVQRETQAAWSTSVPVHV